MVRDSVRVTLLHILEAYNKGLQKWAQITETNYVLTVTHLWTRT